MNINTYTHECSLCYGTGRIRSWIIFKKRCYECQGRGVITKYRSFWEDPSHPFYPPHFRPRRATSPKEEVKPKKREDDSTAIGAMAASSMLNNREESTSEPFKGGGGSFGGAGASGSWEQSPSPTDTGPSSHEPASTSDSSFSSDTGSSSGSDSGNSGGGSSD